MEKNQILMKEKLGFYGMLKESLRIPLRNPNFIFLAFLTSLPLFFSMLIHEVIFQQILIQTANITSLTQMMEDVLENSLLLGLLYLGIVHLVDLINTITTVHFASMIYAETKPMNLKDTLCIPFKRAKNLKGPLITSIYALLLSSLTLLGLVSLAAQSYFSSNFVMATSYGLAFVVLLTKYMEWGAIWNMGMVMSILEDKHGVVALGVSAYISRGNRRCGILLMSIFFVWKITLRVLCHQYGSGIVVTTIQVCLVCLGNVIMWVIFMVYFYDCKKRFLEKKADVEDGRAAESGK